MSASLTTHQFGPFRVTMQPSGDIREFWAGKGRVQLSTLPADALALCVGQPDTWVSKERIYTHLYCGRLPKDRPEPKILDVYFCMIRRAIDKALGQPSPKGAHYLVSDHCGHIGLFSSPQPMGYTLRRRGEQSSVLGRLYALQAGKAL